MRIEAEGGEVFSGDQFQIGALGLTIEGEAGGKGEPAKHVGEDVVVSGEIAEHGMGDGIAAPVAAVMVAAHGKENEFLGILDREKAEEDLVEEGENSGIGADAEGEGQDGDGGEARSAGESAESVLEIAKCSVEGGDGIHFADFILPREIVEQPWIRFAAGIVPGKSGPGLVGPTILIYIGLRRACGQDVLSESKFLRRWVASWRGAGASLGGEWARGGGVGSYALRSLAKLSRVGAPPWGFA
jgi:hypothetical protein